MYAMGVPTYYTYKVPLRTLRIHQTLGSRYPLQPNPYPHKSCTPLTKVFAYNDRQSHKHKKHEEDRR